MATKQVVTKPGWGIGYTDKQVDGGFNSWNDPKAIQTELDRMNTVIQNRTNQGLSNNAQQDYLTRLQNAQKMQQNQYNRTNQQTGWGVGYLDNNVSGGFNSWDNISAIQQELERMNNVVRNRESMGLSNEAQQNYLNKLQSVYKPYEQIDVDKYRSESATIEDIAKKYGFDFSRDYAKRQAEAEAQALRNANADAQRRNASNRDLNLKAIDNNLMSMADTLDRNYFQQFMNQAQNQVNSGINAGIAADQDLRLSMARQANMGDAYRDANLGRMQENQRFTNDDLRLAEQLGLINQQALAYEEQLFNDRLMQGASLAQALDQFNLSQNGMLLNAALQQRSQNLGQGQFDRQMNFQNQQFDWQKILDEAGLTGNFNGQRTLQGQQFDWNKIMDEAGLTGMYNGNKTWNRILDEAGLTGMFNGSPTWDRQRWQTEFDWNKYMDQQNLALAKAAGRGSGGGSSTGRSGSSSKSSGSKSSSAGSLNNAYKQYQQAKKNSAKTPQQLYEEKMKPIFQPSPRAKPVIPFPNLNDTLSNLDKVRLIRQQAGV